MSDKEQQYLLFKEMLSRLTREQLEDLLLFALGLKKLKGASNDK